jgi:hypothetical protein
LLVFYFCSYLYLYPIILLLAPQRSPPRTARRGRGSGRGGGRGRGGTQRDTGVGRGVDRQPRVGGACSGILPLTLTLTHLSLIHSPLLSPPPFFICPIIIFGFYFNPSYRTFRDSMNRNKKMHRLFSIPFRLLKIWLNIKYHFLVIPT